MPSIRLVRDRRTGRFIAKSGPSPTIAADQVDVVIRVKRDKRTGQFISRKPEAKPVARYRHPRTGRFITKEAAKVFTKARVTSSDIERIIQLSPKLQRALARTAPRKRERALRAIRKRLRQYVEEIRREKR